MQAKIIYKITDPEGKEYIGVTIKSKLYIKNKLHSKPYIFTRQVEDSVRKYGVGKLKFTAIAAVSEELAYQVKRMLIEKTKPALNGKKIKNAETVEQLRANMNGFNPKYISQW